MTGSSSNVVNQQTSDQLAATFDTWSKSQASVTPPWLASARATQFASFQENGFPGKKIERWKYTNVAPKSALLPSSGVESSVEKSTLVLPANRIELVFINGVFDAKSSRTLDLKDVQIATLSTVKPDASILKEFKEAFGDESSISPAEASKDAFKKSRALESLNSAFMVDASLISIAAGCNLSPILVIRYVNQTTAANSSNLVSPRLWIHVGANAQVNLVEIFESGARASASSSDLFVNAVSDLSLAAGARVSHLRLQQGDAQTTHVGVTRVQQQKDSHLETTQITLGAKVSREDLFVHLLGSGAHVAMNGLSLIYGKQHADAASVVRHLVPDTTSAQLYKNVLHDESRAVFNGFVHIARDAQRSSASQLNKNLLLSSKAEVDTKPELEIDADDVKATHGATIAQIDPEHVFYLQTRGIDRERATQMLSVGFAQGIAFQITSPALRALALTALEQTFATHRGAR